MGVDPSREVSKPWNKCKHPWGTLMPSTILILGASARAAAQSAIRADYHPIAVDMFGDADLAACCETHRVDDYPHGLETMARSLPKCPYVYTGALENHPALVERIAQTRQLYGNSGRVLRRVRDPFQVSEALAEAGLCCPELARQPPRTGDGLWLRKPFESSGGGRISTVRASAAFDDSAGAACCTARADVYFQRFIDGDPCSALYVTGGGRAVFLGATRQLVGTAWTGATGFQYSGSLGPLDLPQSIVAEFQQIGSWLAKRFGLIGIAGVDAVIAENRVWPVEVNPRYTASVEVLERVADLKTIAMHVRACRDGILPRRPNAHGRRYSGKAIIYADETVTVSERFLHFVGQLNKRSRKRAVADIPRVEQQINAGAPVATVLADSNSLPALRRRLESSVRRVRDVLYS